MTKLNGGHLIFLTLKPTMSKAISCSSTPFNNAIEETKALTEALEAFDGTHNSHLSLLRRVDKIRSCLEEPYDMITRWLVNMSTAFAVNTLLGIGALENIPLDGTVTAAALAHECSTHVSLIIKTMRLVIANGIANEVEQGVYAHNPQSLAFRNANLGPLARMVVEHMKPLGGLTDYIKTFKPEDILDARKSPFAFSVGLEGKTFYEIIDMRNSEERSAFNLAVQKLEKHSLVIGLFPFQNLSRQVEKEPGRPFIVDIGGGRGQSLLAIQRHCGGSYGAKLILQDLPVVVESLMASDIQGIEAMPYNVFTPQPVKSTYSIHVA
jgi:hypothetical protein